MYIVDIWTWTIFYNTDVFSLPFSLYTPPSLASTTASKINWHYIQLKRGTAMKPISFNYLRCLTCRCGSVYDDIKIRVERMKHNYLRCLTCRCGSVYDDIKIRVGDGEQLESQTRVWRSWIHHWSRGVQGITQVGVSWQNICTPVYLSIRNQQHNFLDYDFII